MRRAASVLMIILVLACSSPEQPQSTSTPAATPAPQIVPPTADEAKTILVDSPDFGDFQFTSVSWSTPMKKAAMNEPTLASVRELADAGWVRLRGDDLELAKGEGDKRFLVRPNGFLDIVPLAKKELTSLSQPAMNSDGTARADFCFKWIANEVGASFRSGFIAERLAKEHCGVATFQRGNGGWEVLFLSRREE